MRSIIFILALSLLASCKSQKQVVSDKTLAVDSVARSEHHRTMAVIDSAIRNIDFSFDTLKINIERPYLANDTLGSQPSALGSQTEIIRIKAVRGRVIDQRRVHRDSVEAYNRLDTVAYHQSAAETSTEHTATTRLYNPPDGTAVLIIALIIAGIIFFVCYRKR
ncbi:hypothetical protein [Duncaniella dubosii]|uniref:hypothetical protein n=1 Tax=Duncaniella dubosii TaxID=2518971 RepID=UPI0023F101BA|nr:hypothetical protein [Duncaniella dubosii]MCX4285101.1 hypothetical protein [Duncaniella dubosii]